MVEAERAAKAKGRSAGIVAARDRFYKGDIAAEMVGVPAEDTTRRSSAPTSPSSSRASKSRRMTTYRGYTVYKHGFGSQGPVLLQTLNILENFDLHGDGLQQPGLHAHRDRGDEARVCRSRYLLRRSGVRAGARRRAAVEGVREGARRADRSEARLDARSSPAIRCRTTRKVKQWPYWKAQRQRRRDARRDAACRVAEPIRRHARRTRPTWRSSTRTATSSTPRRAAAGSAAR